MIFTPTAVLGVYLVAIEPIADERGFFARAWCRNEFAERGLCADFVQCNISYNRKKGTLRGMHYQAAPHEEVKLVSCTRGVIYDVVIDLRSDSPSYKQWVGVELSAASHTMLYIPMGCAHGFQTLADDCEVLYQMGAYYSPEAARGVRWNDPAFSVCWPDAERTIAPRDQGYPDFIG